jgi:two-component system, OmpR family, response regulator
MKILVVEDSRPTRELLKSSLEGARHTVAFASRYATGLKQAELDKFDVIVIDIMLPDGNGLDLCREIRELGITTPILFLSARGEVGDRIAGLDGGGDDYMRKPFSLAELHARIRALTRRPGLSARNALELGNGRADFAARRLTRDDQEIPLTAREWDVLELLAARIGRLVPRQEILELVWHDTTHASSESLDVIMSRLRRKLGPSGDREWIRTVRGEGYALEKPT